ncbi:hypothetical protein V1514DRAFT_330739 [Lipomyces japonicus]|uniref:uncharacterized protein n=1 Tax=Lipomyces japonicus TaxID=56871 RepID=UPI0034D00905
MPLKQQRFSAGGGGGGGGQNLRHGKTELILNEYCDVNLQQSVLTLLRKTFLTEFADPDRLAAKIQTVKSYLYERNYVAAFGSCPNLLAYVLRWTPFRALAYLHVFGDLCPQVLTLLSVKAARKEILCIGGGAGGEVLALSTIARHIKASNLKITAIDVADWDEVFSRLSYGIQKEYEWIPQADNQDNVVLEFKQADILDVPCFAHAATGNITNDKNDIVDFKSLGLITMLFTTNELFAQSKPRALELLNFMNQHCQKGTLLLVVESAGSYSHIQVGSKTFPVQFLLDHTLVSNQDWDVLREEESAWFRLDEEHLKYPLQLENMRFFLRLYRKN